MATCQTVDFQNRNVTITVKELESRLSAQKQQLQIEADRLKQRAVEEVKKQTQIELHDKHLDDMAKQVSVTASWESLVALLLSIYKTQ